MANTIVWMDGFENFVATTSNYAYFSGAMSTLATGYNGKGIQMGGASVNCVLSRTCPVPTLSTTWWIASFMVRRAGASYNFAHTVAFSGDASSYTTPNCRMGIGFLADGSIKIRKDNGAEVSSATGIIASDTWYHIEYRHRYGNGSTGNFEVRVNGTSVFTGVGDNSGATNPRYAHISGANGSLGPTNAIWMDDLIIAQSDDSSPAWFGISRVAHYLPTSTVTGQWAGSDGDSTNNHLLVDDNDAASSDWVTSTAGAAQRDLYAHAAATTGSTIYGVQVRAAAGVDVIGMDDFSLGIKSGSTENLTRRSLGAGTPVWIESPIIQSDPSTGTAWTKAGFDASLFGVKS